MPTIQNVLVAAAGAAALLSPVFAQAESHDRTTVVAEVTGTLHGAAGNASGGAGRYCGTFQLKNTGSHTVCVEPGSVDATGTFHVKLQYVSEEAEDLPYDLEHHTYTTQEGVTVNGTDLFAGGEFGNREFRCTHLQGQGLSLRCELEVTALPQFYLKGKVAGRENAVAPPAQGSGRATWPNRGNEVYEQTVDLGPPLGAAAARASQP